MKTVNEILERLENEVEEMEETLNKMTNGEIYWCSYEWKNVRDAEWENVHDALTTKRDFINWIKGS